MSNNSFAGKMLFVMFASALMAGCGEGTIMPTDIPGPPLELRDGIPVRDASPIQTDSVVYHLVRNPGEYRAFVTATYHNTTGAPVYFQRCGNQSIGPMFGGGRTGPDSTRRFFVDYAWGCVGGVPTGTLANGESVSVRVPFGSGDQPNMNPPLQSGDLVGLMRVYMTLCKKYSADSDYCELLPAKDRQSNAFLVTY